MFFYLTRFFQLFHYKNLFKVAKKLFFLLPYCYSVKLSYILEEEPPYNLHGTHEHNLKAIIKFHGWIKRRLIIFSYFTIHMAYTGLFIYTISLPIGEEEVGAIVGIVVPIVITLFTLFSLVMNICMKFGSLYKQALQYTTAETYITALKSTKKAQKALANHKASVPKYS